MNRVSLCRIVMAGGLIIAVLAASGHARAGSSPPNKPNIVFFLVDDMGWMDSTVYGSRYYDTPNMDRLARRSMKFTDAYAANPLCSPTRASIMTGKYPARLRITTPAGHLPPLTDEPLLASEASPRQKMILPRSRRFLPSEEYTIAEALRDAGYRTGFAGKWHLGLNPEHWPEQQGFEFSFHGAPDPGPRSYFSPYKFRAGTVTDGPEGEYITDRVTDEALAYIEKNRRHPFFLCLWHYAVHGPWGHKEDITQRYAGKQDPRGKQNNPIMASMLWSMDESLGRVMDKLDELGLSGETILIFFSDNGGNVHSRIGPDLLPPTNNYPLRGGKAMIYEGGVREPMLVCWPGVVEPGSVCAEVVSSVDFYPTILQMAGIEPKEGQILDGESIVPLLKQEGRLRRDAIYCHFPHGTGQLNAPATSVRKGPWKLIRFYQTGGNYPNEYELYNLEEDLGETNNLAGQMPERVRQLDALIDEFLRRTDALVPIPNPAYDPKAAALGRWVARGCQVAVADGVAHLRCTGKSPFVAISGLKFRGPTGVAFRAKSTAGGPAKIQWRTVGQRQFPAGQIVPFDLPADGQWHELEIKLPVNGTLLHLRLYPATKPGQVDIDWIRLSGKDGAVQQSWEFDN